MKQHDIDLGQVISHGKINTDFTENNLCVTTQAQNIRFYMVGMPINSYIQVPQKFKLPLRVDIRAKMDVPSMYMILGKGHVTFGTTFLDNRRIGDIVEPDPKKVFAFDNRLEMETFYDLSVIYDLKFMQVLVNGEEKFYSKKEKYIKSAMTGELNNEGFELKIAASKNSCLTIVSIIVTEFENDELVHLRSGVDTDTKSGVCLSIDKKVKSTFEECISELTPELQKEIKETNDYLLNRKNLKIKRKIEGTNLACKINYVSTHGFSYAIHISGNIADHFFWWYMVSNYAYENKYMGRKNDLTIETLKKVSEKSPDIAERLFSYYDECNGCTENCSATRTIYEYLGKKKAICHGKMVMNMNVSTFQDLKFMFSVLNEII